MIRKFRNIVNLVQLIGGRRMSIRHFDSDLCSDEEPMVSLPILDEPFPRLSQWVHSAKASSSYEPRFSFELTSCLPILTLQI